jgi:hypothetical protein
MDACPMTTDGLCMTADRTDWPGTSRFASPTRTGRDGTQASGHDGRRRQPAAGQAAVTSRLDRKLR